MTSLALHTASPLGFRNDASQSVPPFAVMQIAGLAVEDDEALLLTARPGTTFGWLLAVNGPSRVRPGHKGACFCQGTVRVAYGTGSPQLGEVWGACPDEWHAVQHFPGLTIVGLLSAEKQIAMARFSSLGRLLGQTTDLILAGSTTTAYSIMVGSGGSETDGGWTTVPDAYSRTSIGAGKFVNLDRRGGAWYLEPAEC